MRVKDQTGRWVDVPERPLRIVSLVPSQTELLAALGLEEQLVGLTRFCVHPAHLRKRKLVVGGTKKVHYDKVRSLQPDIIICNKEENTLEMVASLEEIAPVWVSDVRTFDDALAMIESLGRLLGAEARARELCVKLQDRKNSFLEQLDGTPGLKVVYLIWNDPLMAAGGDTFIHHMLELNGLQNALTVNRYPEVSRQVVDAADVLLLSSEPFPFSEKHVADFQQRFGKKCVLVDGAYFSWYGSRLLEAFDYFQQLKASLDQLPD